MIPKKYDPTPPWAVYEVVDKAKEGRGRLPFAEALSGPGDAIHGALTKMWLVGFHGWPKAKQVMRHTKGTQQVPSIARADNLTPEIWILKAKPSCWRLFFYVYEKDEKKWIIFLHAACKKAQKQDSGEGAKARQRIPIRGGRFAIQTFEFPSD